MLPDNFFTIVIVLVFIIKPFYFAGVDQILAYVWQLLIFLIVTNEFKVTFWLICKFHCGDCFFDAFFRRWNVCYHGYLWSVCKGILQEPCQLRFSKTWIGLIFIDVFCKRGYHLSQSDKRFIYLFNFLRTCVFRTRKITQIEFWLLEFAILVWFARL